MLMIAERPMTEMTEQVSSPIEGVIEAWFTEREIYDRYRQIIAAVIHQAITEAKCNTWGKQKENRRRKTQLALDARIWLTGPDCAFYLEGLGIERDQVMTWLDRLPALPDENDFQKGR